MLNHNVITLPENRWYQMHPGNHFIRYINVQSLYSGKVKVAQLCPALCDPMDSIVHGILQARILEWVAFLFSRGYSQPRDRTEVSCIAGGFFTSWATREARESKLISCIHFVILQCLPLSSTVGNVCSISKQLSDLMKGPLFHQRGCSSSPFCFLTL